MRQFVGLSAAVVAALWILSEQAVAQAPGKSTGCLCSALDYGGTVNCPNYGPQYLTVGKRCLCGSNPHYVAGKCVVLIDKAGHQVR
jgi:hypothetical protein